MRYKITFEQLEKTPREKNETRDEYLKRIDALVSEKMDIIKAEALASIKLLLKKEA